MNNSWLSLLISNWPLFLALTCYIGIFYCFFNMIVLNMYLKVIVCLIFGAPILSLWYLFFGKGNPFL